MICSERNRLTLRAQLVLDFCQILHAVMLLRRIYCLTSLVKISPYETITSDFSGPTVSSKCHRLLTPEWHILNFCLEAQIDPTIAQLAERETVEVEQVSLGHWFESGWSESFASILFARSLTIIEALQ